MKDNPVNVIIETPKGYSSKYVWDKVLDAFKLKKMLPEGMVFPYNFGFIPETKADDGDPADVLVLMEESSFPGCHVEARIIGVVKGSQKEKNENKYVDNPRIIAVASESRLFRNIQSIDELDEKFLDEIEHFFISYLETEGKIFKPSGRGGIKSAVQLISKYKL